MELNWIEENICWWGLSDILSYLITGNKDALGFNNKLYDNVLDMCMKMSSPESKLNLWKITVNKEEPHIYISGPLSESKSYMVTSNGNEQRYEIFLFKNKSDPVLMIRELIGHNIGDAIFYTGNIDVVKQIVDKHHFYY